MGLRALSPEDGLMTNDPTPADIRRYPLAVAPKRHDVDYRHSTAHNPKVAGSNPAPATKSPGRRLVGQGFYRVMRFVPSTGGPGWVLFDELLESAGSFGLHAGEDVLVGVDGECRVGVPQPF